mmetsp:Transcript_30015/g.54697  ORF Transcript_30015/g.54697 Transcript_30015/m.54697 type:complete len:460 (-) Transcript_30015:27-1406(-)
MGQSTSRSMCCAARDKEATLANAHPVFGTNIGQFHCTELEVELDEPSFLVFGPLWQKAPGGIGSARRIALANKTQVRIYRIRDGLGSDEFVSAAGEAEADRPQVALEHTLDLPKGNVVSSIIFCEEASSRNIGVAYGADSEGKPSDSAFIRVWNLDMLQSALAPAHQQQQNSTMWTLDQGHIATLEEKQGPFTLLTTSASYLFGALASGECISWQKSSGFSRRGAAKLHQGGVEDMNADRNFLYTTGRGECSVGVWAVPQLSSVFNIEVSLPRSIVDSFGKIPAGGEKGAIAVAGGVESEKQSEAHLSNVTALRLPLSRWAGSQGAQRAAKAPKGSIYVAAVLAGASETAIDGSGVLMHWIMGDRCVCRSAQIAHNSPIVSMVYGPYDNGPLVTADMYGTCRIWDNVPGLVCSQQIELQRSSLTASVLFAVEPQVGLYTNAGGKRITVWRRDIIMPGQG